MGRKHEHASRAAIPFGGRRLLKNKETESEYQGFFKYFCEHRCTCLLRRRGVADKGPSKENNYRHEERDVEHGCKSSPYNICLLHRSGTSKPAKRMQEPT